MGKKKYDKGAPSHGWRTFLKQASKDLLKDIRIKEDLPAAVIGSAWLGYDGATEKEIAALEDRLGRRLPPSYRSFLAETNGWRNCGPFIYDLWPCSEVRWFKERHQEWIDAYVHPENSGIRVVYPEGHEPPEPQPLTDEEYLVYGDEQDSCRFRTEYLQSALEISDVGDSAILLLNPETISEDGEWEAWLFANWKPGAHRYPSFRELMLGEHESFRQLLKEQGSGRSKYGNAGQQAARRGETDKAVAMLRKLVAAGDQSSAASLAELYAFRGQWEEVITNLGLVIQNLGAIPSFEDYPTHFVRLLARAGHETGQWKNIAKLAAVAIKAEKAREYDEYHQHIPNAFIAWYKNLQKYCLRSGKPPHELIRLFANEDEDDERLDEAGRRKLYKTAVADEHTAGLKKKPAEYAGHCFALAQAFKLDDEAISIYKKHPEIHCFRHALDVSRAYMRKGNAKGAWSVLFESMSGSAGSPPEHVAPIILLIDETLRPLLTPKRCELILSTPRGPEAKPTRA